MSHEKTCRSCGKSFVGFTPVCKDCNTRNVVPAPAPSTTTATVPTAAPVVDKPKPVPQAPPPQQQQPQRSNNNSNNNNDTPAAFANMNRNRGGNRGGGEGRGRGGEGRGRGGRGGGEGGHGAFDEREAQLFSKGNRRGRGGNNNGEGGRGGGRGGYGENRGRGRGGNDAPSAFSHLRKVCEDFKKDGTCKNGTRCRFVHDAPRKNPVTDTHAITTSAPVFGSVNQPGDKGTAPQAPAGPSAAQNATAWRSDN
eukprot:PhF_6_TR38961/c0_g1_i1/m.58303